MRFGSGVAGLEPLGQKSMAVLDDDLDRGGSGKGREVEMPCSLFPPPRVTGGHRRWFALSSTQTDQREAEFATDRCQELPGPGASSQSITSEATWRRLFQTTSFLGCAKPSPRRRFARRRQLLRRRSRHGETQVQMRRPATRRAWWCMPCNNWHDGRNDWKSVMTKRHGLSFA